MKHFIYIMLLICTAQSGWAQKGLAFRIEAGAGLPLGKFTAYQGYSLGHAKLGLGAALEGAYGLSEHFGLLLLASQSFFPSSASEVSHSVLQSNSSYTKVSASTGGYAATSFMAGVEPRWKLGEKMLLSISATAGIANIQGPSNSLKILSVDFLGATTPLEQEIDAGRKNAFAYAGKIAWQYAAGKLQLGLFARYFQSAPTFSINDHQTVHEVESPIQAAFVGLQVGYKL